MVRNAKIITKSNSFATKTLQPSVQPPVNSPLCIESPPWILHRESPPCIPHSESLTPPPLPPAKTFSTISLLLFEHWSSWARILVSLKSKEWLEGILLTKSNLSSTSIHVVSMLAYAFIEVMTGFTNPNSIIFRARDAVHDSRIFSKRNTVPNASVKIFPRLIESAKNYNNIAI